MSGSQAQHRGALFFRRNMACKFRIDYPLAAYRRQYTLTPSHLVFDTPAVAKKSGFYPQSYWTKNSRVVLENQKPAIVPTKIGKHQGQVAYRGQPTLADLGNGWILAVDEFFAYYSEAQTQQTKAIKKKCTQTNQKQRVEPHKAQNTLCCTLNAGRGRPAQKPVKTGVYLYTPRHLVIPDDLQTLENEIRYMVHVVMTQAFNRKHEGGGGRINAQLMRTIIGKPSTEVLVRHWLINSGTLYTDHSYTPGSRSKTYYVNPVHLLDITTWEVTKPSLAAKIRLMRSQRLDKRDDLDVKLTKALKQKTEVENHLDLWLSRMRVDLIGCVEAVGDGNPNLATATALAEGLYDTSRDDHGRYHSPLTRLYTPLRRHVSWDGQSVVQMDVKNSQVVCLVKLIQEHYWASDVKMPQDVAEFVAVVEAGTLYDDLFAQCQAQCPDYLLRRKQRALAKKQWNTECDSHMCTVRPKTAAEYRSAKIAFARKRRLSAITPEVAPVSRADFKTMFFADVLFGRAVIDNAITQVFAGRFPSVWQFIRAQKADGHAKLAHRLQRAESDIFIDSVCDRLMRHHPEVPIATIHDSCMTTADHAALVLRIIHEEYQRRELHPTIKVEK